MDIQELIKGLPITQSDKDELVKLSATATPKDVLVAIDAKLTAADTALDTKYASAIAEMKSADEEYEKEASAAEKEFDEGMDKLKVEAAQINADTMKALDEERMKQVKATL